MIDIVPSGDVSIDDVDDAIMALHIIKAEIRQKFHDQNINQLKMNIEHQAINESLGTYIHALNKKHEKGNL